MAVPLSGGRLRVTFPDRDQMTSWWLFVVIAKSQDDKAYHMPDVGEQVAGVSGGRRATDTDSGSEQRAS